MRLQALDDAALGHVRGGAGPPAPPASCGQLADQARSARRISDFIARNGGSSQRGQVQSYLDDEKALWSRAAAQGCLSYL